jgi:hypothetical protein
MSWAELALYESHDLIRERFRLLHARDLAADKISEISAFFSQGRQYFTAASSAGSLVAPLLYYYGVNALIRGAVLFLDPHARQSTLKPAHGLSIHQWQATLAKGLAGLGALELTVERTGTFAELMRVVATRLRVPAFGDDHSTEHLPVPSTPEAPTGTRLALKEILSRVPGLQDLCEQVFSEPANVLPVAVTTFIASRRTRVEVYGSARFPLNESELRRALPQLANAKSEPLSGSGDSQTAIAFWIAPNSNGTEIGELPPLRHSHGVASLVLPFTSGLDLPPLATLYAFGFSVGMLSRYFPQEWRALQSGSRGDRVHPVVREAIEILRNRFPAEVASVLSVLTAA